MLKISPLTDFRVNERTWNLFALVLVEEQDVVYSKLVFHMRLVSFQVRSVVTLLKCKLRNELLGF